MNILMPLGINSIISKDVLDGIRMQTVKSILCVASDPDTKLNKRCNEARNRNALREMASSPYTLYLDSDIVFTRPGDIEAMAYFLSTNNEWDAVAIDFHNVNTHLCESRKHVIIACMLIRYSVLQTLTFRQENEKDCVSWSSNIDNWSLVVWLFLTGGGANAS